MVRGSVTFTTKEYYNLSRPFFDIDTNDDRTEAREFANCGIHGEYAKSLKSFGCPLCHAEDLDEERKEEVVSRRLRKQKYR
jgi:hypothetical protein